MDKTIGEIDLEEGVFLGELVRSINSKKPIIEIGTHFGHSAIIMTMNKKKSTKLITVDNYSWNSVGLTSSDHFEVTKKLLNYAIEGYNVEQINMNKDLFYLRYSGEVPSLIFLDANHSYEETKKDIIWGKKVGADIICGHDYSDEFPGVIKAVKEMGGYKKLFRSLWILNHD